MADASAAKIAFRPTRLALGFAAAYLATLAFHQAGIELCHLVGLTGSTPYNLTPVPPFGVPAVLSLAFWGGVWGVIFVFAEKAITRCPGGYLSGATLFGAIVPTLVFWFVVIPLKGLPLSYGFQASRVLVALIVDGLWGLGTGILLTMLAGRRAA
ncbi:MAG TPA: hypothetical protein VN808_11530 [Stellaceae bacterium]|nr:hypothetical protein [Stellaceae bacterium]